MDKLKLYEWNFDNIDEIGITWWNFNCMNEIEMAMRKFQITKL